MFHKIHICCIQLIIIIKSYSILFHHITIIYENETIQDMARNYNIFFRTIIAKRKLLISYSLNCISVVILRTWLFKASHYPCPLINPRLFSFDRPDFWMQKPVQTEIPKKNIWAYVMNLERDYCRLKKILTFRELINKWKTIVFHDFYIDKINVTSVTSLRQCIGHTL